MASTNATAKKTAKTSRPGAATKAAQSPRRMRDGRWMHLLMWVLILAVLGGFLHAVGPILLPFVVGSIMAYLFDPLADRLERHMQRSIASSLITFGFFAVLLALMAWLGPLLYHQLNQLLAKVPELTQNLERLLREQGAPIFSTINRLSNGNVEGLPANAGDVVERAFELGGQMVLGVLASGGALLNVLSLLLVTPIVAFYLLRDWDRGLARINSLLPLAYAPTIRALARDINRTLAGYLRGQLYVMLILAVYYVVLLGIAGLKFSLIIGVLAGFLVIIPYIGTLVSTSLGLIVAYSQFDFTPIFWYVVTVFAVGQVLESQILTPKIIGDRVGVHPIWMLFGLLVGGLLFGFVGVLLAVPITAVISVLVRFVLHLYLDSALYTEK